MTATAAAPTVPAELTQARVIPIASIDVVDNNGRHQGLDQPLSELGASLQAVGLLSPITVRPRGKRFELVAGGRRLAAAGRIGWTEISAFVRELTDEQAIAVRIIENDQREDLHPLDQAASYVQLQKLGHSLTAIAEMVSRPEAHVYDRLRVARLIPAAQKIFRAGKIGLEHAIVISRQKPDDQERLIAPPENDRSGLWRSEGGGHDFFEDDEETPKKDPLAGYVARTVAELKDWIDHHVRFDRQSPDLPQLFPAAAANLTAAVEQRLKVIPITNEYHLQDDAKDAKERTYGPMSWKRADGGSFHNDRSGRTEASKTCESSGLGVFVAGGGRGRTLQVCVNKKCEVHWPEAAKEKRKQQKAAASGNTERAAKLEEARREKEKREKQRVEALRARWKKAAPAIADALAKAIAKADATPGGPLGKILLDRRVDWESRAFAKTLAPGKTAESLVRHLAFMEVVGDCTNQYRGHEEFAPIAKALKIDVEKLLDAAAPVKKPELEQAREQLAAKTAKAKKKGKR